MTKSEKEELQELREEINSIDKRMDTLIDYLINKYGVCLHQLECQHSEIAKKVYDSNERITKMEEFIGTKMDGFSFKLEELEAQNDALAERFENATTIENKVEIPEKVVKKAIRKGTKDAVGSSFPSNVKVEEMLKDQQTKMDEISQRLATMAELVRNM